MARLEAEVREAVLVGDDVVVDAAERQDEGADDAGAVLAGGAVQEHGRRQRAAVVAGRGEVLHCRISKRMGGQHSTSRYLAPGIYILRDIPIETA